VIRLRRRGVKAPADWQTTVEAAFPDAGAFKKKARAFERLVLHGEKRREGFAAYAPEVLPVNSKGEAHFPPVWQKHEPTRQKIAGMSSGFCAYCQSPVSSNHPGKEGEQKPPGHVEHFQPKSRFPTLAYEWINYFLACSNCNQAKGDKWPSHGYVRPDRGRPGGRFTFTEDGEVGARRKGDLAAEDMLTDFDITRYWLVRHRRTAIEAHMKLVRELLARGAVPLDILLIDERVAFSGAINQCVRRVWKGSRTTS